MIKRPFLKFARLIAFGAGIMVIAGCSVRPAGVDIHDPFEEANRKNHEFNKSLDRALFNPAAKGYDSIVPDPIENAVSNFASNLSLPGKVINNILQLRIKDAGQNSLRFVLNTTVGIGGLFDPSDAIGLTEKDADFGQTLAKWGVNEGAYIEAPVYGPTTERDLLGFAVDIVLDPVSIFIAKPEINYRNAARVGEVLQDRHVLGSDIDAILYESADSYAQLRSIYLQNRRFNLGEETEEIDPFDDLE